MMAKFFHIPEHRWAVHLREADGMRMVKTLTTWYLYWQQPAYSPGVTITNLVNNAGVDPERQKPGEPAEPKLLLEPLRHRVSGQGHRELGGVFCSIQLP